MSTDDLFKEMCAAADGWASGDISDESLHSAVVDFTDAVQLARPGFTLNALPLDDRVAIVVALAERRNDLLRMARSRRYAGRDQQSVRAVIRAEANDAARIGRTLATAWGLGWKEGS